MPAYHRRGKTPPAHYHKIGAFDIDGTPWAFWLRPPDHKGMATVKLTALAGTDGKANQWAMYFGGRLRPWGRCLGLPTEAPGLWEAAEHFSQSREFLDALAQLRTGELPPRTPRPPGAKPAPRFAPLGRLSGGWSVHNDSQAPDPLNWANLLLWGPEYSYRVGWSLAERRTVNTAQTHDLQRRHPDVYADLVRYMRELR